jgi:hypothetical protein
MYNVSLKLWNTYYLNFFDMFTFVGIYIFDLLENLSLKNKFNYILFKNLWKHMWIKLLKLALSSNNGPYSKHGGHVSNLKKHSPYTWSPWLLLLWMHLTVNSLYKIHNALFNFCLCYLMDFLRQSGPPCNKSPCYPSLF